MFLATILLAISAQSESPASPLHEGRPVSEWVKDLDHADPDKQRTALLAIQKIGPGAKAAVPRLIGLLQKSTDQIDDSVISALVAIGPDAKDAIPALLVQLTGKDRIWRARRIGDAIAKIDAPHIDATRALLLQVAPRCGGLQLFFADYPRTHAATTVRHLMAMANDPDPRVQLTSIRILGCKETNIGTASLTPKMILASAAIPAKEIADTLEKLLTHKDPAIRVAAASSMLAADPSRADRGISVVVTAWNEGAFRLSKVGAGWMLADLLGAVPEKATAALLAHLNDPTPGKRRECIEALGRLNAVALLEEALRTGKNARVRAGAATALQIAGAFSSVPALTDALKDRDFEVRFAAALAIPSLVRDEFVGPIVPVLIEALGHDALETRLEAARMVRYIGPPARATSAALKALTRDADAKMRVGAALALVRVNPRDALEAIKPLTEVIAGDPRNADSTCAHALAEIGPAAKDALPALQKWFASDSTDAKIAAAEAVARIDPDHAEPALDLLVEILTGEAKNDSSLQVETVDALVRIGTGAKPAVRKLCDRLKDPKIGYPGLALAIVEVDPQGSKPACAWVREKLMADSTGLDARLLLRGMQRLGQRAAPLVPAIVVLLDSPEESVQIRGATLLGRIGAHASEALPTLRRLAKSHPDEDVRNAAQSAIARIEVK